MNHARPNQPLAEVPACLLAAELDLAAAWERVRSKAGMAGADRITVARFACNVRSHLCELQNLLAANCYRALPLRVAEVPKKSGGRRLLLVPAVRDRVVLSAVAQWLSARWDREFDPASFAYRPGRGVADALRALAKLRAAGYRWVLDADIRSFFDSIDHDLLLAKLARWLGRQSPLYGWLEQWIRAAVWDGSEVSCLKRGVPQGSPLSPVLANYYLDEFDRRLRRAGVPLVRYADDFVVLARTPFELAEYRRTVESALAELKLALSPEKTRTVTFEPGFRFLGAEIQGEAILLPFDKPKQPKRALWVAPPMPPALLRAFCQGGLTPQREFQWRDHSAAESTGAARNSASAKSEDAASRLRRLLSGSPGPNLKSLRRAV